MSLRLLVTGTDTGVGKTVVAAGLVAWLRGRWPDVRALKPVESGTDDHGGIIADAALLARAAGLDEGALGANVYSLPEPLAPVVAARRAGVTLSLDRLDARWDALRGVGGPIVVEGVGGALVEVVRGVTVADLAARWSLPALVVAGNRLGVLSHTLLTVEALRARGVRVAGVVLNTLHGGEPSVAEEANAGELGRTLPVDVPLLGSIPFLLGDSADDPAALALAVASMAERLIAEGGAR